MATLFHFWVSIYIQELGHVYTSTWVQTGRQEWHSLVIPQWQIVKWQDKLNKIVVWCAHLVACAVIDRVTKENIEGRREAKRVSFLVVAGWKPPVRGIRRAPAVAEMSVWSTLSDSHLIEIFDSVIAKCDNKRCKFHFNCGPLGSDLVPRCGYSFLFANLTC